MAAALKAEILSAIESGCTRFIVEYCEGTGMLAAEIVTELKQQEMPLYLEAVVYYVNQEKKSERMKNFLDSCDGIKVIGQRYTPNCHLLSGRYMVSEAGCVIAVDDGQPRGHGAFAIRSAVSQGKPVRIITAKA